MEILDNRKLLVEYKDEGFIPRFYWKKAMGITGTRVVIKCGDCDNQIEIYYGGKDYEKMVDNLIEIGGVLAHKDIWRMVFKKVGII